MKDRNGDFRGSCIICECKEYIYEDSVICAFCGHYPIKHPIAEDSGFKNRQPKTNNELIEPPTVEKLNEHSTTSCSDTDNDLPPPPQSTNQMSNDLHDSTSIDQVPDDSSCLEDKLSPSAEVIVIQEKTDLLNLKLKTELHKLKEAVDQFLLEKSKIC